MIDRSGSLKKMKKERKSADEEEEKKEEEEKEMISKMGFCTIAVHN